MIRLLSFAIDAGSTMIVILPVMLLLRFLPPLRGYSLKRFAPVLVFIIYIAGVFSAVGIPAVNTLMIHPEFELIPLAELIRDPLGNAKTSALNILLFVPLGFLLPAVWDRYRTPSRTLAAGFGLSLAVELLQIFTFRLTDISDLIMNTLGTGLGYLLFWCLKERLRPNPDRQEIPAKPLLLCLLVFLVMFTVQPLLSGLAWQLIFQSPLWQQIR